MKKITLTALLLLFAACSQAPPGADVPLDTAREYANALYNQGLYWQAVSEYGNLLDLYSMDGNTRANINYTIGNIYYEDVGDYANALSFYLKVKHLYPESTLIDEVNKKVVACLERLGKSTAARAALKESASLDPDESPFESLPGDTVAVVNDEVITTGELDRYFNYYWNSLPPEQRTEQPAREDKILFLRDYIRSVVLYNSAKMQQFDRDREVVEVAYLQKKELMIQKLLQEEVQRKIQVTDEEAKQWYEENKSRLTYTDENKNKSVPTFEEAKNDVIQLLRMQKARDKQGELTDRLIESQKARLFPDNIKQ